MGEQTLIGGTETDEGDAHLSGGCTLRGREVEFAQ